jgi:hypothetical protein
MLAGKPPGLRCLMIRNLIPSPLGELSLLIGNRDG